MRETLYGADAVSIRIPGPPDSGVQLNQARLIRHESLSSSSPSAPFVTLNIIIISVPRYQALTLRGTQVPRSLLDLGFSQ